MSSTALLLLLVKLVQDWGSRFRKFRAAMHKPLGMTTWKRVAFSLDQVCVWGCSVAAVTHIVKNYLADRIDGRIPLILGTSFPLAQVFSSLLIGT